MGSALDMAGLVALLERADKGELVLLPTDLAARRLRAAFDRRQRERGLRAWEPPRVQTWTEWTRSLWSSLLIEGLDDRVLLNRLQEQALWAEIIAAHAAPGTHLGPRALDQLAALACSALDLAAAHLPFEQIQSRLDKTADSYDAHAFAAWYKALLDRCSVGRLLPESLLEHALVHHAAQNRLRLPSVLHLAGFERLTPTATALLDRFRALGASIHLHQLARANPRPPLRASVQTGSPQDELRWAIHWLRQSFTEAASPDVSFALVLPNPSAQQLSLEPLLREILAPELERVDADLSSTPWHFSGGSSLSGVPLIHTALLLLRWTSTKLPLEEVSQLLLSPFVDHSEDLENRATFDLRTLRRRDLLRPELSLDELLAISREHGGNADHSLNLDPFRRLRRLSGEAGQRSGNGSHGEWAEHTRSLLRAVGWPGSRALSAAEFRATEAWEGVLDRLATLDVHGNRIDLPTFLALLEREAAATTAPSATPDALLQIARLSDLEGCIFDAALVLEATDQTLPPPERAHPLLGWSLQQALGLPGADPSATHARALDQLQALLSRCGDLLLLAPAEDENGPLRLTPIAAELGLEPVDGNSLLTPVPLAEPVRELEVPDTVPLPALPSPRVPGGARVLELQAACGFRAFATLRLHAEAPESPTLGLDARRSGQILHRAMQHLWSELKTRQALADLTLEQRKRVAEEAAAVGFEQLRRRYQKADAWTLEYLGILEQRLANLIQRWLRLELDRRGDFTVSPPEQEELIPIGPLELKVRLDRVDQLEDGYAFIDYKTGFDLSPKHWLGDRPEAPQLPLYTMLAEPEQIRAVAFARMRPGKDMAWLSLQDRPGLFPTKKRNEPTHDLPTEIVQWRFELERLAYAFADGNAEVDPRTYPKTCQHCDQRLLCRVNPTTVGGAAQNEAEASIG